MKPLPNSGDAYLNSSQHKHTLVQTFIISHLLATAIIETTDIHILQVPQKVKIFTKVKILED